MAYNPFLSMDEPVAPVAAEVLNPFTMSAETEPNAFAGDNPFATSNPFSDFGGGFEPPAGDAVPADIFGTADQPGMGAKHFDDFSASEIKSPFDMFGTQDAPAESERLAKPTELDLITTTTDETYPSYDDPQGPVLPARPLPPETQNLILSVTGQMDFASSHLLDRIPPTRTPSPVSVRDLHSACPTPEPEAPEESVAADAFDINRNKPVRPPPARPPPVARPPPPRPAPPPVLPLAARPPVPQPPIQPAQAQFTDDINLFDAPVPTMVKPTKEAIMSLYSAPKKEEKQVDFLSDDILEEIHTSDPGTEILTQFDNTNQPVPGVTQANEFPTAETVLSSTTTPITFKVKQKDAPFVSSTNTEGTAVMDFTSPMDCSEPPSETIVPYNTSPFSDAVSDNVQNRRPSGNEKNPFEDIEATSATTASADTTTNVFADTSTNVFADTTTNAFADTNTNAFANTTENAFADPTENAFTEPTSNAFAETTHSFIDNSTNIFGVLNEDTIMNNTKTGGENIFPAMPANEFKAETEAFKSSPADAFGASPNSQMDDPFTSTQASSNMDAGWGASEAMAHDPFPESQDAFDAFSAKFDSTSANHMNTAAWGDDGGAAEPAAGFEAEAFDSFLSMAAVPPPPAATPQLENQGSHDSGDDTFYVSIRPKEESGGSEPVPVLAPPPRPQALPESPRVNPFDKSGFEQAAPLPPLQLQEDTREHSGSGGETPPTPLFDDDVSQPLEDFPRTVYKGPGWEMQLRQPNKKKITGQRFWKAIFVRLTWQGDSPVVQLFNSANDKEPFQELPLQACYSVSEIGAQQYDQYGKIFTVKLQYVFYKERPGVRPGQVTKAERITNKLTQFAAYAIQGDYQGVKEFGSDLRKLGLPVEHAPQVSQLFKIGSLNFEDVKQFSCCVEEALFKLQAHRDRALTYKMEEVQITAVDELYVEQDAEGCVLKQIARVRLFFLGFLSGMPDVELGVNDLRRQGKEVVGRHDIIPVVTEEWIRVENTEFHACVQPEEFANTQIIKFKPPDACYIELMRFRVRPPKNRELPLQLKAVWCVTGNKVELRADVLVPGFASRKLGQVPCEDVCIRFPIPECWIYLFRVEKHFRYGSVKSAHRRTGKIKGIERFLGAVDTLSESLIEVTSGQAKYEHQHRAIVWRMPRLPKEGQGAYTTHNLVCRMALTSYDQIPAELARHALVEFTMPATQVSHMTVRSVSLQEHDNDPPEKYVRYLARHEYIVGIERTSGQSAASYDCAAAVPSPCAPSPCAPAPAPAPAPALPAVPSSDSDSD